jgi:hypothetical protein
VVAVEPRGTGIALFMLRAADEVRAAQFGGVERDLDAEMVAIAGAIIGRGSETLFEEGRCSILGLQALTLRFSGPSSPGLRGSECRAAEPALFGETRSAPNKGETECRHDPVDRREAGVVTKSAAQI